MAAEVGFLDLAYDYLMEAATMDLNDLEKNTYDGVHMASLAGGWIALVWGFGGMRDHGGKLTFAPRLPPTLSALEFALRWRGAKLHVSIKPEHARYRLDAAQGVMFDLAHYGDPFSLESNSDVTIAIPPLAKPSGPAPHQPAGREPGAHPATALPEDVLHHP
jgi:alpha,alpha-trehalose phosphorylase